MADRGEDLLTQAVHDEVLIWRIVGDIVNGNRRDARLAIRSHFDPAWLVVQVIEQLAQRGDAALVILDVMRLMGGPSE